TAAETAVLLREAVGADLPAAAVAALAARTEGWAAGLQLAGLSLQGQADPARFVATFSGSHRYVLDYLAGEVLAGQTDEVREFLLETSVLERLSGGLCDAVTGRAGGQAMLEQVERAGLFLTPLDEVRGWWRYHHLFADLLRARLRQQRPGRLPVLHRNAAAWCEEHGLADDAVRYALGASDTAWAARLIERNFDTIYYWRSEGATIRRWVSALPADLVQSRPRLLLVQALIAATSGNLHVVEPLLDAAERAAVGVAEVFEPTAGRAGSMLVNIPALIALHRSYLAQLRGDAESTAAFASQVMSELGEDERLLGSLAQWNLAVAEWLRGRTGAAADAFASSIAEWRVAGQPTLTAYGGYQLVQVQRARGDLDAAVRACQQTLEMTAPLRRAEPPAAGPAHVGLAEVAYQRDEIDTALAEVTEGIGLCRQFVYTAPLVGGLVTLAWIRHVTGDRAGAVAAMREAELASEGPAGVLNPAAAQAARLLLAQGDAAGAARWVKENGLGADDEPDYAREPGYLVLARALLAGGEAGRALGLLERLHAAAAAQDRVGSVIEIGALRALALAAGGETGAAVEALAQALTLGRPQGYVRVFADEGRPMSALLAGLVAAQKADQAAARGVPLGYVARVLRACGGEDGRPGSGRQAAAVVPGLIEQLTARELEILVLLAAGTPNPRIAAELAVTVDTVKKHVSHLLAKLGATNRTEAVTRARQIGLIP
ncbi:MAG: hypothetical protein J2P30_11175, partial [Actinobacteria bacterium]|nr:hypothetical protein [Actinomycetota bacterium]